MNKISSRVFYLNGITEKLIRKKYNCLLVLIGQIIHKRYASQTNAET